MLLVYGSLMPLWLLEEISFWKIQEKEHTLVIRVLVPPLETGYVEKLMQWEAAFAQTHAQAQQWIEAVIRSGNSVNAALWRQIHSLMMNALEESMAFIQLLIYMMSQSPAVQQVQTAPAVIMHIIRESEYFLGIMQGILAPPAGTQLQLVTAAAVPSPLEGGASSRPENGFNAGSASLTGEGVWTGGTLPANREVPIGGHVLPPLPYNYNALEPYIDEKTMRIHHDHHHQTYVDGLNKAELKMAEARQTGDYELIKHWEREAAFHGAGHYLHTIYWHAMSPKGGGKPKGALARQIEQNFGSFEAFQQHFTAAAQRVEGGGWAVLVWSPRSGRLEILQAEKNQDLSQWDAIPLLALDVWEHAHYLKYQNNRSDYITAWWNVVNWPYVNERYGAASQLKWQPY